MYKKPSQKVFNKTKDSHIIQLAKYELQHSKFLGKTKTGEDYETQIMHSMGRYALMRSKRENLFAFIMPAGHGKTTMFAKYYGFIDVDQLITKEEHEYYVGKRIAIMNGIDTWSGHNSSWYDRMNKTLDLIDLSRPTIICVHTEECALELGATILAAVKLKREVFLDNIKHRDKVGQHFSRMNYDTMVLSNNVTNRFEAKDNRDLERYVIGVMNACNLPVANPYKYSRQYKNYHYTDTVPKWVLTGEEAGNKTVNIKLLVDLYEQGHIPKECVDYHVRKGYTPTQFDFGINMNDWADLMSKVVYARGDQKDINDSDDMMEVFPCRSPKEKVRSNVTVRRLINVFDIFNHEDARFIAEHHVGEPQAFVASILTAWKGIMLDTNVAHVIAPFFLTHYKAWPSICKELHAYIRTSRFFMNTEINETDRQACMYMDLLVGREEYEIDELSEVKTRSAETYATEHLSYDPVLKRFTNEQYKKDFQVALEHAHLRMKCKPRTINLKSFGEFYARRKTWLTKGGLVYNKMPAYMKTFSADVFDQINGIVTEIQGRHNKQSLFEMHELWEILRGVNAENFNMTKTQIKYETGGKKRTLLPGSLAHFIVFCYVLHLAEKQEQVGSVRLNAMPDEDILYFDRKMSTGVFHVLYDWADFNEQHSADEMAAVINTLSKVIHGPEDYSMFVNAIVEGMYTMGLEDRTKGLWKLVKGLYSGWRGTTWVNSVLNFAYTFIGLLNLERITGRDSVLIIDHGGDDLDAMLSEPTDLVEFLKIMDKMLFSANKWKQMFGKRSEFFRNTISGATVYASPTRALASFVAGDWEGAGNSTVRERVVSLLDQIGKLRRRGVNEEVCQGLTMCTLSHWCRVKNGEEWSALPDVIRHGHPDNNGLGIPDINNEIWRLEKDIPVINEEWYKVVVPNFKSSRDYIAEVEKDIKHFSLAIENAEKLAKKLAEDSFDIEKRVDHTGWVKLLNFESKIIKKEKIIEKKEDKQLFEEFLVFEKTEKIELKYAKASRYQEYIGYLSYNNEILTKEQLVSLMSEGQVCADAVDFQGNIYYRRLVPEFMAYQITLYCKEAINEGYCDKHLAKDVFETLCYMANKVYGHKM